MFKKYKILSLFSAAFLSLSGGADSAMGLGRGVANNENAGVLRTSGGTMTGPLILSDGSTAAGLIGGFIPATEIGTGSVDNTEFGYLDGVTSALQTQLNGKQATGSYLTTLTGDGTASGPGSAALTLATVNANVGTFGSVTKAAIPIVNAKGLITGISESTITPAASSLTGTLAAAQFPALTGDVTTSAGSLATTLATVTAAKGGTGQTSYAVGDIPYASGSAAISKLADVATGNALISGGVTTAPSWGKIGLTTHISGTLAEGNGGTNQTTYSQGDLLYANAANTLAKLTKDTNSTRYLSNTGSSNNPAWSQIDVTNGITGAVPAANGGTGQSSYAIGDLIYASGSTALSKLADVATGSVLRSGGVTTAPLWGQAVLTTDVTGILPAANGGEDMRPLVGYGGANFNGSTTYYDTNALTGIADGQKGTLVFVMRFANAASATEEIIQNTGTTFRLIRGSTGKLQLTAKNSGGTSILNETTTSTVAANAGTYVIEASYDLTTAGSARIAVNDVSAALTETVFTNDTTDYTVTEYSLGATVAGASFFTGDMYEVYFDPTTYTDFNTASNRRKFADVNNVPVFLGNNCELPTGTPPALCLAYSASDNWDKNRGLYYATSFTRNGAIADATTILYGQYGGFQTQTNTAAGTTGAQTINRAKGCVNFAAAATTLVVTDNLVLPSSIVLANMMTNDATALGVKSVEIAAAGGSFTLRLGAGPTGETKVCFAIQ